MSFLNAESNTNDLIKRWRTDASCVIIQTGTKAFRTRHVGIEEESPVEAQKTLVWEKMREWERVLDDFRLPGWDDFPVLPLYMDQVIYLMNRYLLPLPQEDEQKPLTPAMINNYVKLGIIPRPVKKRYGRTHLAYLIMVCVLKRTVSTAEIKKLVPASLGEEEIKAVYEAFSSIFHSGKQTFRENAVREAAPIFETGGPSISTLVFQSAVMSSLWQSLAEQVLSLYPDDQ